MIKSVWVENNSRQRLDLDFRTSGAKTGITVFTIEGLGAPPSSVNAVGGPSFDGVKVNSVKVDARQIVLTLATSTQGDKEEDVKSDIYKYFPYKQKVKFGVVTDRHSVYIDAIVESLEPNHFAKVQNYVIGLYCPEPYWKDASVRQVSINPAGTARFEFPFSNESLQVPLLIFGDTTSVPMTNITYSSGAATGIEIDLFFEGEVDGIKIVNTNGAQEMNLWLDLLTAQLGKIRTGDRIRIDTRQGRKKVEFYRIGIIDITYSVLIGQDWIQLLPGNNTIIITAETGEDLIRSTIQFNQLREAI